MDNKTPELKALIEKDIKEKPKLMVFVIMSMIQVITEEWKGTNKESSQMKTYKEEMEEAKLCTEKKK